MITQVLEDILQPSDHYIFGLADLRGLIDQKFGEYTFGISIGKRLDDEIINGIVDGPTMAYYNHCQDMNKELASIAGAIRMALQNAGFDAIAIAPSLSKDANDSEHYLSTLTVELSHKMVATRAGLGWIGKTDLFVSKAFGPRVRLVSLLIKDTPDTAFHPVERSRCGSCTICVEKCPAHAANGLLWDIHTDRDMFFDAHKCRDLCGTLAKQRLNIDQRICGLCIAVCPIGMKCKP